MNNSDKIIHSLLKYNIRLIVKVYYILAILIVSANWNVALAQSNLFAPINQYAVPDAASGADAQTEALRNAPTTAAMEIVRADLTALDASSVVIALPDGGSIIANRTNTNVRGPSDYSWFADLPNGGTAILVVRDGQITGTIQSVQGVYRVTPLGDGQHAIVRLDLSKIPPELPALQTAGSRAEREDPVPDVLSPDAGDTAITVDILVAYTPAAAVAAGDILALIQLAIDESNQAYSQSDTNVVLNLVGTMGVDYTEAANWASLYARSDLKNGAGVMAAVHAERDAKAADLVALLVTDEQICGAAYLDSDADSAFSVTAWDCATGVYTFAHEIGHNFGAHHDPLHAGQNNAYPYGHGYIYSTEWRTIMSYEYCNNCPRIPWFSNPNKIYNGQPMGTVETHDNARVHRERVATVAAFRTRKNQIRDFNGDGFSDIIWRNNDGFVGIWLMQPGG